MQQMFRLRLLTPTPQPLCLQISDYLLISYIIVNYIPITRQIMIR